MNNLKEFWHIVPVNDGYHYVCETHDGKHFLQPKAENFIRESGNELIFGTRIAAQDYINHYLDYSAFKPEKFLRRMEDDSKRT